MNEMDERISKLQDQQILRYASALAYLIILLFFYDYKASFYTFAILQFSPSLIWFLVHRKEFLLYKKYPSLWYIPASIDVFLQLHRFILLGVSYSPVIVAYILITCMSSVDLIRARGLFYNNCKAPFLLFLSSF